MKGGIMKRVTFADDFTDQCYIHFGHDIEFNGYRYHIIFGHHSHGGFICIPTVGVCCEASDHYYSASYNTEKLMEAGLSYDVAQTIAIHIEDYYRLIKMAR